MRDPLRLQDDFELVPRAGVVAGFHEDGVVDVDGEEGGDLCGRGGF